MHIPDAVLAPSVLAATGVVAATGFVSGLRALEKRLEDRTTVLMGTSSRMGWISNPDTWFRLRAPALRCEAWML